MMNLRDEMDRLAGPAHTPTSAEIDADLTRGRRALRRRRTAKTMAGSAFAVAALAAAVAVTTSGTGFAPTGGDTSTSVAAARLVAYTGAQPKGFTIDKVPAGWYIQDDDDYNLLLAPENPSPSVNPSFMNNPDFAVDKIIIMLQTTDQNGPYPGKAVKVGDRDGVLVKSPLGESPDGPDPMPADGDTGWTLWIEQPNGVWLLVQFWQGLGFSESEMIEMGAGVQVHEGAVQGRG